MELWCVHEAETISEPFEWPAQFSYMMGYLGRSSLPARNLSKCDHAGSNRDVFEDEPTLCDDQGN